MKRNFRIAVAAAVAMAAAIAHKAAAQDLILKTDGTEIIVDILQVSGAEVRYTKYRTVAPIYVLAKSEIFMIKFENSEKEVYGRGNSAGAVAPVSTAPASTASASATPASTVPASAASSAPAGKPASFTSTLPPASKAYKPGDIYDENGQQGVVVATDESGRHGLIMSLKRCDKKWLGNKNAKLSTAAYDESDGEQNLRAIEQFIATGKGKWADFPLFEWARSLGEGWYIPAVNELGYIATAANGKEAFEKDSWQYEQKTVQAFQNPIDQAGGDDLVINSFGKDNQFMTMFASTETNDGKGNAYVLMFQQNKGQGIASAFASPVMSKAIVKAGHLKIATYPKKTGGEMMNMGSRAVRKF
ncbi:MAG: hypothetical protein LBL94_07875 [Prevotellaceae bacterium]|jgi:hypothetical protein|nr:hypothetical protein [Prevotellaceae bacterium]